ncbi:hypothetical protein GZ77_12595 [Endozoicomonas montiporae]|uniref:Uncharacterized protein n=2 Tax=Endozoicomonas montiporae TaxID=1027273 RepID=A0A081N497_9GAMM|nr:hypothetical protein [Endozoicomonas montiporae]AMO57887.1 hypothetical protein EZMO1_3947 [Endozoicomonas montiporae CL-33]KEQ13270.1 hypothetical protein GZ77_12595 [Endozoicomonas montiporae]
MSYPKPTVRNSSEQHPEHTITREFNPFDVPFEVILHELNAIAREFCLTPLQSLLSEGFEDLDDLKAAIAEMSDRQLARRLLAEVDIIIDEYRRGIALL